MTTHKTILSLTYEQILETIPHRDPFLLVDRVEELVIGEKITAFKMLHHTEPVFKGHFPSFPIYPGVYLLEGMAQASAILVLKTKQHLKIPSQNMAFLTGIDEARFRKQVFPGDVLKYSVTLEKTKGPFAWCSGQVFVGDVLAAEAKISAATKSD